jgi:hypothetical protein
MNKWLIGSVFIISGAAAYGFFLFYKKPPDIREEKAIAVISAIELVKEYTKNESQADKDFAGKTIIVSGIITEVRSDSSAVSVSLSSGDALSGVTCIFYPEEAKAVRPLNNGDMIRIKGKCNGKLMDVILNNCSLVQ